MPSPFSKLADLRSPGNSFSRVTYSQHQDETYQDERGDAFPPCPPISELQDHPWEALLPPGEVVPVSGHRASWIPVNALLGSAGCPPHSHPSLSLWGWRQKGWAVGKGRGRVLLF